MKLLHNSKRSLRKVETDTRDYIDQLLQQKSDDTKIQGNIKYAKYIRMLIIIENQKETHTTIKRLKQHKVKATACTLNF